MPAHREIRYILSIVVLLAVFDSSTKFPESVLMGQSTFLGNFDECIEVEHVDAGVGVFSGQYCLVKFLLKPASFQTLSPQNIPDIEGFRRKVLNMRGKDRAVSGVSEKYSTLIKI
jgi:hypothetical protein